MNILITSELINSLMISLVLSIIVMTFIQKIKGLSFIKSQNQILILDLLLSFGFGVPYVMTFYEIDIKYAFWICLFCFIGAPTIYEALKKQNIINFKMKSLSENYKNNNNNE